MSCVAAARGGRRVPDGRHQASLGPSKEAEEGDARARGVTEGMVAYCRWSSMTSSWSHPPGRTGAGGGPRPRKCPQYYLYRIDHERVTHGGCRLGDYEIQVTQGREWLARQSMRGIG